jgi:hypothetical protein
MLRGSVDRHKTREQANRVGQHSRQPRYSAGSGNHDTFAASVGAAIASSTSGRIVESRGKRSDGRILVLRVPQSFVDRALALIDDLAEEEEALLLGRVSRSIVFRLAILRGLETLEARVRSAER